MLESYTYEKYTALYEALDGKTTHFMPVVGTQAWSKPHWSRADFEAKLARLIEIESHDDDWLFENHPTDYQNVSESEMWEQFELRSTLFVIELENYEKLHSALIEV